jgi:hypothetical protein
LFTLFQPSDPPVKLLESLSKTLPLYSNVTSTQPGHSDIDAKSAPNVISLPVQILSTSISKKSSCGPTALPDGGLRRSN